MHICVRISFSNSASTLLMYVYFRMLIIQSYCNVCGRITLVLKQTKLKTKHVYNISPCFIFLVKGMNVVTLVSPGQLRVFNFIIQNSTSSFITYVVTEGRHTDFEKPCINANNIVFTNDVVNTGHQYLRFSFRVRYAKQSVCLRDLKKEFTPQRT